MRTWVPHPTICRRRYEKHVALSDHQQHSTLTEFDKDVSYPIEQRRERKKARD
jgi:hypothetical protein